MVGQVKWKREKCNFGTNPPSIPILSAACSLPDVCACLHCSLLGLLDTHPTHLHRHRRVVLLLCNANCISSRSICWWLTCAHMFRNSLRPYCYCCWSTQRPCSDEEGHHHLHNLPDVLPQCHQALASRDPCNLPCRLQWASTPQFCECFR